MIYLHGGSQRGNDLGKLKAYGPPMLVDQGRNFNCIIAMPQCPDNKYWSSENWLDSLLLDLNDSLQIDNNRIYLTGVSMGGYGTWIVGMDYPEKFAALVPLCGGCNDEDTGRICTISKIPVWTFHGTADDKVAIAETERIVERLKTCNSHVRFTKLKDKGHGIEYLYADDRSIYKWMLKQKRSDHNTR